MFAFCFLTTYTLFVWNIENATLKSFVFASVTLCLDVVEQAHRDRLSMLQVAALEPSIVIDLADLDEEINNRDNSDDA